MYRDDVQQEHDSVLFLLFLFICTENAANLWASKDGFFQFLPFKNCINSAAVYSDRQPFKAHLLQILIYLGSIFSGPMENKLINEREERKGNEALMSAIIKVFYICMPAHFLYLYINIAVTCFWQYKHNLLYKL
ncbi:hypothetical protein RIF29_36281 [Crotalaria pallida]|uniref:Uncharacterized protein n=1 Tax=Crotalaria pallida TaxID=3830 RepID=A0AAN9HU90_CROPI